MQSPYLHETLTTIAMTSKKIPGIPFTSSRACLKKAFRELRVPVCGNDFSDTL